MAGHGEKMVDFEWVGSFHDGCFLMMAVLAKDVR
jgi:hypothetical protein